MKMKAVGAGCAVLCGALALMLSGCAPQEDLIVPPRSAMVGKMMLKQIYVLQRPTVMVAMGNGGVQPEIHLTYDKNKDGPPPAEAFERVPFQVSAEEQELEPDPNNPNGPDILVTENVPASWGAVALGAGTQISISSAEVYGNSHLYRGRVLNGFAHNCFVLLVVPAGATKPLTMAELQAEDRGYLAPLQPAPPPPPAAPPATQPQ
jgi:hypothetical protein